ncbi:MAG: acetate--CoA ligase family protein, partial [Alcaligenaceae bacterium]|nr:acetate--CoA ligase family protein [Alcaligenaceae bacterium]
MMMQNEINSKSLVARYGIETSIPALATTGDMAQRLVQEVGDACALKVVSADIVHKVDAGGVRLSVTEGDAGTAFDEIIGACRASYPDARIDGVLVERMVAAGLEV